MESNADYKSFLPWKNDPYPEDTKIGPDDRSGRIYLYDPKLQLAAEIAIVTQRPLLIRGDPGSGKSSFAPFAARNLNWCYFEKTITGRTEAKDLLWKFDALARLRDAQAKSYEKGDIDPNRYITPGVLWWAFNRDDAYEFMHRRNEQFAHSKYKSSHRRSQIEPFAEINHLRDKKRAVVLIDEIDKAEPEVPNDLLEIFGQNRFTVDELEHRVERVTPDPYDDEKSPNHYGSLLIIITTNQERDLPAAFLRRCIVHTITEPERQEDQIKRLEEIADLHLGKKFRLNADNKELTHRVAEKFCQLRQEAEKRQTRKPSTAEFLDALRSCLKLHIFPSKRVFSWEMIPGEDNEGLLKFLSEIPGLEWTRTAKLDKIDEDKTIKAYAEEKSILLKLNEKRTEVILEINGNVAEKFSAKMEMEKLNVYSNDLWDMVENNVFIK